jgi:hypothetical protein
MSLFRGIIDIKKEALRPRAPAFQNGTSLSFTIYIKIQEALLIFFDHIIQYFFNYCKSSAGALGMNFFKPREEEN